MQVVFHVGAHCTDEGQIQACLANNRQQLAKVGIVVPNPGRFRPIFWETIDVLKGEPANAEVQQVMLDSIINADNPERIIFSNSAFLSNPQRVMAEDKLYPDAAFRVTDLNNLFPDQEVEFCLAIRNPATLLPAVFAKIDSGEFDAYLAQTNPLHLRWSEMITRLRDATPNAQLKVWCNEDTPFIWPELLTEISDHGPTVKLSHLDDYTSSIMTAEGVERLNAYLATHPPSNEAQRRRILSAFLDKFEIEDRLEPEPEAPEWTEQLLDNMTDAYEDDLYVIERMTGVQFIAP